MGWNVDGMGMGLGWGWDGTWGQGAHSMIMPLWLAAGRSLDDHAVVAAEHRPVLHMPPADGVAGGKVHAGAVGVEHTRGRLLVANGADPLRWTHTATKTGSVCSQATP
eukprot:6565940-Pyramimonas_sp.AAC.1